MKTKLAVHWKVLLTFLVLGLIFLPGHIDRVFGNDWLDLIARFDTAVTLQVENHPSLSGAEMRAAALDRIFREIVLQKAYPISMNGMQPFRSATLVSEGGRTLHFEFLTFPDGVVPPAGLSNYLEGKPTLLRVKMGLFRTYYFLLDNRVMKLLG